MTNDNSSYYECSNDLEKIIENSNKSNNLIGFLKKIKTINTDYWVDNKFLDFDEKSVKIRELHKAIVEYCYLRIKELSSYNKASYEDNILSLIKEAKKNPDVILERCPSLNNENKKIYLSKIRTFCYYHINREDIKNYEKSRYNKIYEKCTQLLSEVHHLVDHVFPLYPTKDDILMYENVDDDNIEFDEAKDNSNVINKSTKNDDDYELSNKYHRIIDSLGHRISDVNNDTTIPFKGSRQLLNHLSDSLVKCNLILDPHNEFSKIFKTTDDEESSLDWIFKFQNHLIVWFKDINSLFYFFLELNRIGLVSFRERKRTNYDMLSSYFIPFNKKMNKYTHLENETLRSNFNNFKKKFKYQDNISIESEEFKDINNIIKELEGIKDN